MSRRLFAVIGHPIGHTMSPFIHKRLFELAGTDGKYTVMDIAPQELQVKMKELDMLAGYNITIPHKQAIIPYLDGLDKKAELYGSVNTVRNGEKRTGFTTDPDGFLKALEAAGIPFCGRVIIIGCGGVARTFAYEAALAGCDLTIAARQEDMEACKKLSAELEAKLDFKNTKSTLIGDIEGDYGLLVNATPVGMYPKTDAAAVSEKVISRCENVFDAVYNPLETKLVKTAKANGSRAAGGMAMLVWQAVRAHEIWDGSEYNNDDINQLIEDSAKEQMKNF